MPPKLGHNAARDALDGAITAFAAAGVETPRLDAEVLLAHVLGVERARLVTHPDLPVQGEAVRRFQNAVRRRAVEREPVAYITGVRHFRHLELHVDRRALIPRPETELLVEVGLTIPRGARVLDLATGSGAVALALKHERPDLRVAGSDVSEQALALARENAERLGLDVTWWHADLLVGVHDADPLVGVTDATPLVGVPGATSLVGVPGEYIALLANLPYVAAAECGTLPPETLRHEPPEALFAGADGLDAIRALTAQLAAQGGRARVRLAALEVGSGQAATVGELLRAAGFPTVRAERDLAGIARVVVGERSGG